MASRKETGRGGGTMSVRTLIVGTIGLMCAGSSASYASGNYEARVALHLQSPPSKGHTICGQAAQPPCNDGEATLTVQGNIQTPYYCYLLILDANELAGVSCGVTYNDQNFRSVTWTLCGDSEYTSPNPPWPAPGSGNSIIWSQVGNCQNQVAPGDLDGGVTAVAGAFYVYAYTDANLAVTRNQTQLGGPVFQVADCSSATYDLFYPQAAGSVALGSEISKDPCKGPFVSLSDIQAASLSERESVLIKLTDVSYGAPHIVLLGPLAVEDSVMLASFHRIGIDYALSEFELNHEDPRFSISLSEVDDILGAVANLPGVADGGVDAEGILSLGVFTTVGTIMAFESITDSTNTAALLGALTGVLQDPAARRALDMMMCELHVATPEVPVDITSEANIQISGFRMDHVRRILIGTARVENATAQTFPSPITLMLQEGADSWVLNADGVACRFRGPTFYTLEVGADFDPGESVEIPIEVKDTGQPKFQFNPLLLAGPGLR